MVAMSRMLFVALGDATNASTRGGTPYFLSKAGKAVNFISRAAPLDLDAIKTRRLLWNLSRFVAYREKGGYQFSRDFAEQLFRLADITEPTEQVLSQFPLFPPDSWLSRSEVNYYIDATLKQNFDHYGVAATVGKRMRDQTLARERERYHRASRVVCMSRWCAESMVTDYGVDPKKVHVIPAGANVDGDLLADLPNQAPTSLAPLRLGFLGKDVVRKNLSFMLEVADALAERGIEAEVAAAGFPPESVARHPRLCAMGMFDKRTQMREFIAFIRSCHFGCLFSRAEAFGLSNVEFIRLGVPVLTWDEGGQADTVPEGLGHVFPAGASAAHVADKVALYVTSPATYDELRATVGRRAPEVGFDRAIEKFQAVWRGSEEYSYLKRVAASSVPPA